VTVSVIVGGASGIGAALAEQERDAGHDVSVWDVQPPADIRVDISDEDGVRAAVEATVAAVGLVDRLSVCAGVGSSGLLTDLDMAEWDRVQAVNTRGPMLVMREWARRLAEHDRPASFVAVTSVSAHLTDRNMGAYCASKAALNMVVKVAAAEWGAARIRVNAVGPGVTDTPMLGGAPLDRGWLTRVSHRTALGSIGSAAQVARVIAAVHGLDWVTGQIIDADGGLGLHSPIDAYEEILRSRAGEPADPDTQEAPPPVGDHR